jgi:hypothetical protein
VSEAVVWDIDKDSVLNGKLEEIGVGLKAQFPHHAIFMKGYRPRRETQDAGSLLHGFPFGQELDDFSRTRCEGFGVTLAVWIANEKILHSLSNLPRDDASAGEL